jgi:hypothetical protein
MKESLRHFAAADITIIKAGSLFDTNSGIVHKNQ